MKYYYALPAALIGVSIVLVWQTITYNQKDCKRAIADLTEAIRFNPNYDADAYYNRGVAHYELGDKQGGIADLQKAAQLYRQQGKTTDYQKALEFIRKAQQ